MTTRCKPGDLAIIIDAFHRRNLGRIVRVIRADDGSHGLPLKFYCAGTVWLVESEQELLWSLCDERYRSKRGPAPDSQLQPISPRGSERQAARLTKKLLRELKAKAQRLEVTP